MGEEITKRLVNKLIMDLRIAHNPHLEKKEEKQKLIDELLERQHALWGPMDHGGELDKDALDRLKGRLQKSSQAIKVR